LTSVLFPLTAALFWLALGLLQIPGFLQVGCYGELPQMLATLKGTQWLQ
jgi:hypothetical protein